MQFIALFFPSLLGTNFFTKVEANIESVVHYIFTYFIFVLWTNVVSIFTVTYVLGVDGVVSDALKSFSFFMIYTVMACFFSVMGAIVGKAIRKKIKGN